MGDRPVLTELAVRDPGLEPSPLHCPLMIHPPLKLSSSRAACLRTGQDGGVGQPWEMRPAPPQWCQSPLGTPQFCNMSLHVSTGRHEVLTQAASRDSQCQDWSRHGGERTLVSILLSEKAGPTHPPALVWYSRSQPQSQLLTHPSVHLPTYAAPAHPVNSHGSGLGLS